MPITLPEGIPKDAKPIITDTSISWEHRAHPGDWQINYKACMLFAMASWIEIMFNKEITDNEVIKVFQKRGGEIGVSPFEAHDLAKKAGWFPIKTSGLIYSNNFDRLLQQPMLAVYKLNRAWRYVGNSGKIKSWGGTGSLNGGLKLPSTHAVVIIGKHTEPPKKKTWYRWNPKKTVWYDIENSWGPSWGRDGFAQILDKVHNVQCRNTFIII